ncbi:hypothetical protein GQ600_26386 [Phytophthora cactorum]|nr:hypothetical protein GQ600_26386 [Phytophthora cactorum]
MCGIYAALLAAVVFLIYSDVTFAAQTNPTTIQSAETTPSHFISRNNQKKSPKDQRQHRRILSYERGATMVRALEASCQREFKVPLLAQDGEASRRYLPQVLQHVDGHKGCCGGPQLWIFSRYAKYYEGHKEERILVKVVVIQY